MQARRIARDRLLDDAGISLEGVLEKRFQLWWILGAGLLLSLMGLIDDRKNLHWVPRLLVQIGVACGLVFGAGVYATVFAPQPIVGQVLSVFWILVLVNSFNFLDNMDGLSAGIALIAAVVLASVMLNSTEEPRWLVAGLMLVLVGSLVGFLCHNWHPARIFMGDTGSYFIGLLDGLRDVAGNLLRVRRGAGRPAFRARPALHPGDPAIRLLLRDDHSQPAGTQSVPRRQEPFFASAGGIGAAHAREPC